MMHSQENMDGKGQKANRARHGALGLVLGLLCVLAVVTTANAYVTRTTHTTLADFELGTFTYTGLVDLPGVESVQLLPVGLEGEGWTFSNRTLPDTLSNLVAVASDGRLYVGGGTKYDLSINDAVWFSQVAPDGSLGAWQAQLNMPTGRTAAGFAVHALNQTTSMLYVVGGYVPDPDGGIIPLPVLTNTIVSAQINRGSGVLESWAEEAEQLPVAIQNPSVVVHDDWLYVIGGWDRAPGGAEVYNKVLYAPINTDGSLGAFVETSPLTPTGLYYGLALVYEGATTDTAYFVGGLRNDTGQPTSMVQFADFAPGGGLSAWASPDEGNLPRTLWGHGGVYLSEAFEYGEILLTGGIDGSAVETEGISSTVKVALVDPNSSFRLYDWCQGASEEECDIGAWQTGRLLDENLAEDGRRAFHVTAASGNYAYVLGGQGLSQDGTTLEARDTIFVGRVGDVEAMYSPQGTYDSIEIDLLRPSTLLQLTWETTINRVDEMSLTLQYRYREEGMGWSDWTDPIDSIHGTNAISITSQASHPEDIRYFQYRANLGTRAPTASPRLNLVQLYYDVPDPDLAVTKDTGHVISVTLGSNLVYNIHYRNNGGFVAEDTVLTEFLPDNTTFAGTAGWEQVGTSNVYTYLVGDVPWGEGGTVPFEVVVNSQVLPNTKHITNRVEIDYPPMVDIWDNTVIDPVMADNAYEFSNELNIQKLVDLTLTDLIWEPDIGLAGIWPRFRATVVNSGTVGALTLPDGVGFRLELYIKPELSDPPSWPSDHDMGYCLDGCTTLRYQYVADVGQLPAGESVEVWFEALDQDPSPDFPAEGTYDIYVQVDVAFDGDNLYYGRYQESNEANNILKDTITLDPFLADHTTYLPLVFRGAP